MVSHSKILAHSISQDKDKSDDQLNYVPEAKISRIATIIGLMIAVLFLIAAVWLFFLSEKTHYTVQLIVRGCTTVGSSHYYSGLVASPGRRP